MGVVHRHTADHVRPLTRTRAAGQNKRGVKEYFRFIFSLPEFRVRVRAHQAAENFLSSSSSESLWMVMMLTAGLGVSEMTMG